MSDRGINDIDFTIHLISVLKSRLLINPEEIFGMGFSNGGVHTLTVAAQVPCLFAAIGAVGSSVGYTDINAPVGTPPEDLLIIPPPPQVPTPVIMVNGHLDTKRPFFGGLNSDGAAIASVGESVDFWLTANGCQLPPTLTSLPNNFGTIHTYDQCNNQSEVTLVELDRMTHKWPEPDDSFGYNASEGIVEFFKRFTRRCGSGIADSPVPTAPGSYELYLNDQGFARLYRLIIPQSYNSADPAPLVVACHGGGQSAQSFSSKHPKLTANCESEGMILVYPEAILSPIQKIRVWSNKDEYGPTLVDDVAFLSYLVEHVKTSLSIDCARVYATGFSSGGGMSMFWPRIQPASLPQLHQFRSILAGLIL